ncbi:MAG: DLW-39 family protein [Actinomycetota bacterium]|nr:DLW-39 family protein [Actinomycetota bacterium]
MKKLLLIAFAAAAGLVAKRKTDQTRREQDLWQQATDNV